MPNMQDFVVAWLTAFADFLRDPAIVHITCAWILFAIVRFIQLIFRLPGDNKY